LPKYKISFPINKNIITQAIIDNNYNIKKIVRIIHPEIRIKMNEFMKKNKLKKAIVLDIPLLMENKINKKNDILIFVDANKNEISKRLKKRLNFNNRAYKKFKKLQLSLETKRKKSNFLIKNNFNNQLVEKNVKIILNKILYA